MWYVIVYKQNSRTGQHVERDGPFSTVTLAEECADQWAVWSHVKKVYISDGSPYFVEGKYRQIK